ncbi:MAG: hypothetical protein LBO73_04660 [Holosporaceae bacterium]|jgi:hypothetical protein|nr:hypothetical protein [Holosporaceae bacterium]
MKIDFRNINSDCIKPGSIFFLYGNYRESFEVFCDFVRDELRKKFSEVILRFCSMAECSKLAGGQCGLFGTDVECFCVRNTEDVHLEKAKEFFKIKNSVFILESGNYAKAKKITEYFLKSNAFAVPSFNNELTLRSLLAMFFPNIPRGICDEAIKIIGNTDEGLYSILKKISLISGDGNQEELNGCFARRQSFLSGLEIIPLIRVLLQAALRKKITKSENIYGIEISNDNVTNDLLKAELMQKSGFETGRSYIYRRLISDDDVAKSPSYRESGR